MEAFVQLTLEDYEKLKNKAESHNISVNILPQMILHDWDGRVIEKSVVEVKINMRELKLQICKQNGIDPDNTVVEFY